MATMAKSVQMRLDTLMQRTHSESVVYENEFLKYIKEPIKARRILCLDPGETMGWSIFEGGLLCGAGQLNMKVLDSRWALLTQFIRDTSPTHCVMENYIVYGYKVKDHAWSSLFTPRLIGAIDVVLQSFCIPVELQMAAEAKMFAPDLKLKRWGVYMSGGLKHANDSIRHGLYNMLKLSQTCQRHHIGAPAAATTAAAAVAAATAATKNSGGDQ